MKVFYIASARMPTERAHGIQIAKMCEAFLEEGIDLTLVVPTRGKKLSLKNFYGLRHEIDVVRLPVLPLFRFGKFAYRLAAFSFVIMALGYLWRRKLSGLNARVHLIDIDQVSLAVIPFSPFPVTLEIHDAKPATVWFRSIFRHTGVILTINNIIKQKISERFDFPLEKIVAFPNGIDRELFRKKMPREEARRRLGLPTEGKFVMYTGQFYAWKGLEIFPAAARLFPDATFYLVGGDEDEFKKITNCSELPSNLKFAGKRPFLEVPLWLQAADAAVVLGTRRDEYSFWHTSPMKLFEYLAAEVPIVAARTPAIADQVSEREVTFYEPDQADSFVAAVKLAFNAKEKTLAALKLSETLTWKKRAEAINNLADRFS